MMGRDPGQPVQTRVPSHGQNECSSSRISTLHLWRRDPDRSEKTRVPPHGLWEAAHMEFTSYGWRPGPAH